MKTNVSIRTVFVLNAITRLYGFPTKCTNSAALGMIRFTQKRCSSTDTLILAPTRLGAHLSHRRSSEFLSVSNSTL